MLPFHLSTILLPLLQPVLSKIRGVAPLNEEVCASSLGPGCRLTLKPRLTGLPPYWAGIPDAAPRGGANVKPAERFSGSTTNPGAFDRKR